MFKYAFFVPISVIFLIALLLSTPVYSRDNTVVATVFDIDIRRGDIIESDSKNIYFLFMPKIFLEYKKNNKIQVSDKDIDQYILGIKRAKDKFFNESRLELQAIYAALKRTKEFSKDWEKLVSKQIFLETIIEGDKKVKTKDIKNKKYRENARQYLEKWKIDKSIYNKYGGRLALKELFTEPVDAYYKLLKEHEKNGNIKINDAAVADIFWSYFENSSNHIFVEDRDNVANALLEPSWLK